MHLLTAANFSKSFGDEAWRQHDRQRPKPPVVQPGGGSPTLSPPSDAVVLFDGKNLDQWQMSDGKEPAWRVQDGAMFPVPDVGPIQTRESFGDVQLHLEWQAPTPPNGSGQGRGNSGVYLMTKYEVQVLDSFENETYADGQAAAIYGQTPPLVNACRQPGEWQSYDIVFRAPRFTPSGGLLRPATLTVFHNGILVQDHFPLTGRTSWLHTLPYTRHASELPISLQDHGNPVRYRNIWVRRLDNSPAPPQPHTTQEFAGGPGLDQFVGSYRTTSDWIVRFDTEDGRLLASFFDMEFPLRRVGSEGFQAISTDINFQFRDNGQKVIVSIMGDDNTAVRQP